LLVWAVDAISLLITAGFLPGIALAAQEGQSHLAVAAVAALIMGLVNFLIRAIILLTVRSFGLVATFVVGFFVNAVALLITAALLPGFQISGIIPAVIGGLVLAAFNTLLIVDDSDSFYEQRIRRLTSLVAQVASLSATWLGVAEAHQLHGWRTLALPLMLIVVSIIGPVDHDQLISGAGLSLQSIGQTLGLVRWCWNRGFTVVTLS